MSSAPSPGLARGQRLPSLRLTPIPDGEPTSLRGGRGPRVLLVPDPANPAAIAAYVRELTEMAGAVAGWGGRLVLIVAGPEDAGALGAGGGSSAWRVLADPECQVAARLGLTSAVVVVADEWGEIYFAAEADAEHDMPAPEEIVEWVRFISIQCPECEQPEGEWKSVVSTLSPDDIG